MYKHEKDLGPDAIENWASLLDKETKRILDPDEAFDLFMLKHYEKEIECENKIDSYFKEYNGSSLIYKRLVAHTFTMSKAVILFCGSIINTPGEMVMMLNYFQYKCHCYKIKHINMEILMINIIPDGWFSSEILQQYWEKQKYISSDNHLINMLDNSTFMGSIRNLN